MTAARPGHRDLGDLPRGAFGASLHVTAIVAVVILAGLAVLVVTMRPAPQAATVAPWFRGLFSFSPDAGAIATAPVIYQVHATMAWLIWAIWPFSRLVHAWSAPLWYLWRPYIVYRSRRPVRPAEPGTSRRRWRKIGVPY